MQKLPVFRIVVISIVLLAMGVLGYKVLIQQKEEVKKKAPPQITIVATGMVVNMQAQNPVLQASGRFQATETMELVPEVSAKALETPFKLREGMRFSKGDTLLVLDDEVTRNSVRSAMGDLMNAVASILPDMRTDWPNQAKPWEKFLSELTLDHLPVLPEVVGNEKIYLSRNKVFALYYNASNLQLQLQKHVLLAPFYGTVLKTTTSPSSLVRAGVSVAQLSRTDGLELALPLPASEVRNLSPGNSVNVLLENGADSVQARIIRIAPVVDAATQTQTVYLMVSANAKKGVLAGAYASVRMKTAKLNSALALPRSAMPNEGVVHLIRNGRLENVAVEIARRDIKNVYITAGVNNGDTILTQAIPEAVEGMPIKVQVKP